MTDANLFLGRILAAHFPFPLDERVVDTRLEALRDEVHKATAKHLEAVDLAEGLIQIANAHMAAAIKKISIAKGYDLREYALVTFGGAAGQHACAVARSLGIHRVIISPFAGVLSALGIGAADVSRIAQRSVYVPLCGTAGRQFGDLQAIFASLTDGLREQFRRDGISGSVQASRSLDLCYVGQGTLLTVPADNPEAVRERFEARHRQLYGYVHADRAIEVRVARVSLTALASVPTLGGAGEVCARASDAHETTPMVVGGQRRLVPLWRRSALQAGVVSKGPALITDEHTTVVVEPGWDVEVRAGGDLLLIDRDEPAPGDLVGCEADPIHLELFNNRFAAIAGQMGATLRRTAVSVNVKERLDFSCAVFDPQGNLVVNAPHIPVHLGGMSDCVKALIEDVGTFAPGDVYITNDPYRGGSHLNDVTVITPVHAETPKRRNAETSKPANEACDALLFFVASRAHHAEIGGTRPGSMPPDSTCLAHEGVLIRAFGLVQAGKPRYSELREMLVRAEYPSRAPDENLADLAAQVAANHTGVRELRALVSRHGIDLVRAYMGHIQHAAERKVQSALAKLHTGTHRFADELDDGTSIRLAVTLQPPSAGNDRTRSWRAVFDFTGTSPVHAGNLNANRSIVTSALLYCLRCLIHEDIPLNGGVLAPIEIVLPDCFLNPTASQDPRDCPAIVGGNVETSQRVVDVVFGALQTVAASQGTMNNLLMGNDRFGYYETICGGAGAGPGFHGADAVHTHMTNTRLTDPEVLEARYPMRLVRFAIRHGSGGKGRFHGGCGVIREIEFLEPLDVSILSQRRLRSPYGLKGGADGRPGRNVFRRVGSASEDVLPPVVHLAVRPGDRLTIETPGGGGYGWSS